jgi:hypothetical protein
MTDKELIKIIGDSVKNIKADGFKINTVYHETKTGFKIEIVVDDVKKIKLSENSNLRISKSYGFTQNIVGMEFESTVRGIKKNFKITGFKPQNRKYPIIAFETQSGSGYKFPIEEVKRKLGGDKIINRNANLEKLFENE